VEMSKEAKGPAIERFAKALGEFLAAKGPGPAVGSGKSEREVDEDLLRDARRLLGTLKLLADPGAQATLAAEILRCRDLSGGDPTGRVAAMSCLHALERFLAGEDPEPESAPRKGARRGSLILS